MAPKPLPRPTPKQLKGQAGKHKSNASLARALGIEESTFSKWYNGDKEFKASVDEVVTGPTTRTPREPEEVEDVAREEVLAQRVDELERAERKRRKVDVLEERVLMAFDSAIKARKPVYNPKVIPSKRSTHEHEFVLLWSDTHAGEVVSEVETNGLNAYDWRVMLKRHEKLRESLFSFQDNRPYPVSNLHVFALGDMLSGDIHDELVETNEMPLAEATIQFALDGSTWLESLLERFAKVNFSGVVGNHPRSKRKPQAKQAFNNADWLAYRAMQAILRKQKAISWDIPKASAHPVEVLGRRLLLWHGDGVRSSMPGVPWGGVMRRATTLSNTYAAKGMPLDHLCVGHFHQANIVDQGRIAMNGSVKGVDEYSLKAFGGGGAPQQLLLVFHPKKGLTEVCFLDCE